MLISRYFTVSTRAATRLSAAQWWCLAIPLLIIRQLTQNWLDSLYALSQFPVPFYVGQMTFNAAQLKSYYAVILELGTFDRYWWVQIADYAFMLTVFISFFALMAAIYRSLPKQNTVQTIARCMLVIAPLAAVFDALENAVSFVLLADPAGFADWLVYPYSSFAVIKFAIFFFSYLWALVALVIVGGSTFFRYIFTFRSAASIK